MTEAIVKTGIALAIVGIPTMVRLARTNTLAFAQREFVLAPSRGVEPDVRAGGGPACTRMRPNRELLGGE